VEEKAKLLLNMDVMNVVEIIVKTFLYEDIAILLEVLAIFTASKFSVFMLITSAHVELMIGGVYLLMCP